jgi:hypothetical protein
VRQPEIRAGFAHWVVRKLTKPGERPVHLRMVFRSEDLLPPGATGSGNTSVETLYDEGLTGRP